jgi:hypothetical protein
VSSACEVINLPILELCPGRARARGRGRYEAQIVEDAVKGKDIRATIKQAAAQTRTVSRPMSLNAYKVDIAQGLIEPTVLQALG